MLPPPVPGTAQPLRPPRQHPDAPFSQPVNLIFGLTEEQARAELKKWLESKHTTLWQQWIITSEDGMDGATSFIWETLLEVLPLLRNKGVQQTQLADFRRGVR